MKRKGMYTEIRLGDLIKSDFHKYDISAIKELAASIERCGLQSPLTVIGPNHDGKSTIISGYRRYLALKVLGYDDGFMVPCFMLSSRDDMDDPEEYTQVEDSNLQIRQLTKEEKEQHRFDLMEYLVNAKKKGDIKKGEVAKTFSEYEGLKERTARMYQNVYEKGSDDLINEVKTASLSLPTSARIANNVPKEHQRKLIDELKPANNETERGQIIDKYLVNIGQRDPLNVDKEVRKACKNIEFFLEMENRVGKSNTNRVINRLKKSGKMFGLLTRENGRKLMCS